MQKKIIALAIAAAISAPAFADTSNVTVYGVANVSVDSIDTGNGAAGLAANNGFKGTRVSSNTSRIGLKGSEDLGDGLSAVFQIETLVQIDNAGNGAGTTGVGAGNGFGTRNTFAGLSSKTAGTVLLGRHDTPYNLSNRKYDLFGDGLADNRSIMGGGTAATAAGVGTVGASFNGRQPNVLAYISPAFSGLTGAIAYVTGADAQAVATQAKGRALSASAMYVNDAISANVGYEQHDLGAVGTGTIVAPAAALNGLKESAWTVSAGYKVDAFEVNGVYEKTSDNYGILNGAAGNNALGHSAYYLSGKYNIGAGAVKLAYTKAGVNALANTGATQVSVGYDYSLSKRTMVYATYTQLSNETAGAYGLSTNGTGASTANVVGTGAKPSALSLGLKHTF
ncbi:MAG: porin [Nitrosomonadales bacterium]